MSFLGIHNHVTRQRSTGRSGTGHTSLAVVTAEVHMQSLLQRRPQGPEPLKFCRCGWYIQLQVLSTTMLHLRSEFRWQLHQTCHCCISYHVFWLKKELRKWSLNSQTFFSLNNLFWHWRKPKKHVSVLNTEHAQEKCPSQTMGLKFS